MKKSYYSIKNILLTLGIVLVLIMGLLLSMYRYHKLDITSYSNVVRTDINDDRYEIEKGNYRKSSYDYIVFDRKGNVLHADEIWDQKPGDQVNVEEMLQVDKNFSKEKNGYLKYSFILKDEEGACDGFAVFLIPKEQIENEFYKKDFLYCFVPVVVSILISSVILILWMTTVGHLILRPLQQISESAKAIIAGNYDVEVQRVYGEELKQNEVGDLTYSFELMRDELKAKQLSEQSLKKAQQELMSCISHDLRTPISTIKAYSEGLRDGVIMEGMDETDYFNIILKKTDLLEKMIKDLLTYSNAQLNKMEMNRKEIYFRPYMMEIAREISLFVKRQGVDFKAEIMEEDMILQMDEKRITEVLYNLVENSLKYMDQHQGKIRLTAKIEDGVASIHITDNGMGIGGEDLPFVFDKFYRAEKSRSSNIPGSGLGLSICKYIVEQHGGEICCRSRKSKGSEFWFTLPGNVVQ